MPPSNLFGLGYGTGPAGYGYPSVGGAWNPLRLGSSLAAWYKADAGCYTDAACLFASASSQYLSRATAEPILRGAASGFWRAIWVKTSTAGLQIPVDMRVSNDQGYRFSLTLGGNAGFGVGDGATSIGATVAAPSSGAWALLYGDFDGTTVRISKNAGSFGTAAFSGSYSDPVGQDLNVGRDGVGALVYFDGGIARFFGGNGKLSDAQITALYAAGAGLFRADLPADIAALTGFAFNLCEASSTRVDSVGALNLTPTNGPTVAAGPGEGLAVNNSPVKRVEDQSGNARHLLQATLASQPLWMSAIQGGRPVLRFDGVDDLLRRDNGSGLFDADGDGIFYFACAAQRDATVKGSVVSAGSSEAWSSNPNGGIFFSTGRLPSASLYDGAAYRNVEGAAVTLGVFSSVVSSYVPADASLRLVVDGVTTNGAHEMDAAQNVRFTSVGRNQHAATPVYGTVDIGEFAFGRYGLNSSNRVGAARYLKSRWGTP